MRIKIAKDGDWVNVQLTTDTFKAPLNISLTTTQVKAIVAMLQTAEKASTFKFELDI